MPALGAVGGGVTRVYFHIADTSFHGFVFQYEIESAPALLRHLFAEPLGFQHSCDVEVLNGYPVVGVDQPVGEAEVRLDGLFLQPAVLLSEMVSFLDPGPRPFHGSAETSLRSYRLSEIHGCGR